MADLSKAELLDRIAESRANLERVVGKLSPAAMEEIRGDGWSIKQHLAHLSAWRLSLLGLLRRQSRDTAMGFEEGAHEALGMDGINDKIAERAAGASLETVLAEFRSTHQDVLAVLDGMTDADLQRPYSDFDPSPGPYNEHPVIGWVDGNTYEHDDEHKLWIEAELAKQPGP